MFLIQWLNGVFVLLCALRDLDNAVWPWRCKIISAAQQKVKYWHGGQPVRPGRKRKKYQRWEKQARETSNMLRDQRGCTRAGSTRKVQVLVGERIVKGETRDVQGGSLAALWICSSPETFKNNAIFSNTCFVRLWCCALLVCLFFPISWNQGKRPSFPHLDPGRQKQQLKMRHQMLLLGMSLSFKTSLNMCQAETL